MQDPTQPQPGPRNPVGYRPLLPPDYSKGLGNSAFAYVAAATGLGLVVGLGIAFTAGHASASVTSKAPVPRVSDALQTHSSAFVPVPVVYAASNPPLLSKVGPGKPHPGTTSLDKKPSTAPLLMPATAKSSAAKPIRHHRRHAAHKITNFLGKLTGRAKRKPYVSETAVSPAAAAPTGLDKANAAAAAGPFFLGIEGDVTIAGYEPTTGVLQTYEGETYILAKNSPGTGTINWQNYPFNVHYRCDEIGDCTLIRGHASATAKLTK